MVPLAATLSSRFATSRSAVSALSNVPAVKAAANDFTLSLIVSLRARLCARRLMLWRIRFLAEREWATCFYLLLRSRDGFSRSTSNPARGQKDSRAAGNVQRPRLRSRPGTLPHVQPTRDPRPKRPMAANAVLSPSLVMFGDVSPSQLQLNPSHAPTHGVPETIRPGRPATRLNRRRAPRPPGGRGTQALDADLHVPV